MKKVYLLSILFLSGCVAYTEDYEVYRGTTAPAVVYTQPQAVYVEEPPAAPIIYWERQSHYVAPLPRAYYTAPRHYEPRPVSPHQVKPVPHKNEIAPKPHNFKEPRKPAVQPVSHRTDGRKEPHEGRPKP